MQWIEVNVAVTHEAVEAVADMLTSIGSKGVAIEDPQLINDLRNSGTWELCDIPEQENTEVATVSAYYADDEKLEKRLAEIDEQLALIEERIGKYRFGNTRFRKVSRIGLTNGSSISMLLMWARALLLSRVGRSMLLRKASMLLKLIRVWLLVLARITLPI